MRFSNLVHLYLVRVRRRLVGESLAMVGIAVGVALVFAAVVAGASLTGSVKQLTSGIVGQSQFQLSARGPDGMDAALLSDVQRLGGVKSAAPILEARAIVTGPAASVPVELVGGDPRFASLGGSLLHLFTAAQLARQRAVALPAPVVSELGLGFGGAVGVQTGAGTTRALLGAELHRNDIGTLVDSPVAVAPLAYAQELSGMHGKVTRIFVQALPGRDRQVEAGLRQIAGSRLNVLPADADVAIFNEAAVPTTQSTVLFSVFAALVGWLFACSAVLLTVPQRRRFIADLRLAGHPPSVIVRVMLFDALVLGIVGSLVGLVLGAVLSRSLFSSVPGYLAFAFPVGQQRVVGWESVAIALATGVVAACVAVLAPLREIMSRRPLQQPAKAGRQHGSRWLAAAGVVCVLLAVGVLLLSPVAAIAGVVCLTAALLLLLPTLIRATILAIGWIAERVDGPVPLLAVAELRARSTRARTFALAATAAVAVFAAVAVVGAYHDLQRGLDGSAHQIDRQADVWVTFPGEPNAFATTPFAMDAATISETATVPGVASVRPYRGSFLDVGDRRVWVLAPEGEVAAPIPAGQLTPGSFELADERVRAGGWVVLSDALAKQLHAGVGDRVTLPTPNPTPLRVAALSTNLGWPSGAVILNARDYARAWGSSMPSGLQLDVSPGASASAVARELRELPSTAALTVETSAAREQRHYAAAREGLSRLTQIAGLVLGAAVLALASAMGGVLWQRRPKLGALKVDGLTELELWRALLLEAALLLGAGSLAGAIFGLGGQVMLNRGLVAITGFPVTYQPAVTAAAAICGIVVVVAVAMLAVPGWLAVRVRPMPGLQV